MLQKLLAQKICAMVLAGLLGMAAMYLIYGKIEGGYVGFGEIIFSSRPISESAGPMLAEMDGLRNKILAGGCAGVLIGLFAPSRLALRQNGV